MNQNKSKLFTNYFDQCQYDILFQCLHHELQIQFIIAQHIAEFTIGEQVWKKYAIVKTVCRWNNVSYLQLIDRKTGSKYYDMMAIPRTASVHDENIIDVQNSFESTCHILNKLEYPTICQMINSSSDEFNFCCVTRTPDIRSLPEMLNESINNRNICYSEHFISQLMNHVFETLLFCHKHDIVNFNLNISNLGFDNNLRPILLDFSRNIILSENDKMLTNHLVS
eukprot:478172_1